MNLTRRSTLRLAPFALPLAATGSTPAMPNTFPTQPPELAKEMVSVSHGNFKRVRELVEARPSLAKAAWDWGFGDWETALGAASHVGNHEIAEFLIANGAHPTLFSATMLGHLDIVKAFITAQPGVQKIAGPHSISLLAHAVNGKSDPVRRYLESLGDAGTPTPAPFTDAEASALAGNYIYGPADADRIEISAKGNQLTFTRQGTTGRGLVPVGNNAFHPAGAAAVRIRFAPSPKGMELIVHDPDPVLTATRL